MGSLLPVSRRAGDAMIPALMMSPILLAAGIAVIGSAATMTNCALLAALMRKHRNGLFNILTQLAIADLVLLVASTAPELWSSNMQSWIFGDKICTIYRGFNVFASTASLYLVITVSLHTLSNINLDEKLSNRRNTRKDLEDDEIRSSRHSLVAASDSSTPPRTMDIDYRIIDKTVSVRQPTLVIWILAVSLSIPEFILATATKQKDDTIICGPVESNHLIYMQMMIALFNLVLPSAILMIAFIFIIIKRKSFTRKVNYGNKDLEASIKLSIFLTVVQVCLCFPRLILNVMYETMGESVLSSDFYNLLNVIFNGFSMIATLIRPLYCLLLVPKLKTLCISGAQKSEDDDCV